MTESRILSTDDISRLPDSVPADQYGEKVRAYYNGLLEKAITTEQRVKDNQGLTHSPVLSILHDIAEDALVDQVYECAISTSGDQGIFSHTVSVAIGSMKVGMGMKYDRKKLLRLGLAAFLENVGMYKIPDHILKKEGALSQDEIGVIRRHPEDSALILGQMGGVFQWLAEVASQVHERSDGSGYPKGLKGEEITEAASIIGIMDTYVAMIKNRPYREKIMESEVVKSLIGFTKGKFPQKVVKEFLNQVSLFPLNTYVRLNNKSIGRVIHTDRNQPFRPTIELLYDGLGEKLEKGDIIPLSDVPVLHIVDTIDERDLH